MGFLSLLKALDELVYELMSWLIFYPITLWRALRHPLAMMEYGDAELSDTLEERYTDTLSPPLFLLVTLLISHGLELAFIGQSELVKSKAGLGTLVTDDTNLILLRLMVFSIFPIIMAAALVRGQRREITRKTLQEPFYSQCYPAALLALSLGFGTVLVNSHRGYGGAIGATVIVTALLAYWVVETRWFAHHLQTSLVRGFGHASLSLGLSLGLILVVASLFR